MLDRLPSLAKNAARRLRRPPAIPSPKADARPTPPDPPAPAPSVAIAKWRHNHAAAISLTYDAEPNPDSPVDQFVLSRQMTLDYELVTQRYTAQLPPWVQHDLTPLIPRPIPGRNYPPKGDDGLPEYAQWLLTQGFGFFGHGHWHVNHDALTYPQARDSFRLCREIMQTLRLNPIAYGYPRGNARKPQTRQALADAGFLAGRLAWQPKGHTPYIMPHHQTAPQDWHYLPALQMESYDFRQRQDCINDTAALTPILDQALTQRAWIIPVYHNIGNPKGWGFYRYEHFQDDIQAIAARDFWTASMNDITLYAQERANAQIEMRPTQDHNGQTAQIQLTLTHRLDPHRFNHPLTLLLTPPPQWQDRPIRLTQPGRPPQHLPPPATPGAPRPLTLTPNQGPCQLEPAPAP